VRTKSEKNRYVVVLYGKNIFHFEGVVSHLKCVQTVPFFVICSCIEYFHAGRCSSVVTLPQYLLCGTLKVVEEEFFSCQANVLLKPTPTHRHHRVVRHTPEVPGGPSDNPQLNRRVHTMSHDP